MAVSHVQEEFEVQGEGLPAGPVIGVVLAIAAMVMMATVLTVNITNMKFQDARINSTSFSGYPLLEDTRSAAAVMLSESGAVAGEDGVYQIPIGTAMQLVVEDASSN